MYTHEKYIWEYIRDLCFAIKYLKRQNIKIPVRLIEKLRKDVSTERSKTSNCFKEGWELHGCSNCEAVCTVKRDGVCRSEGEWSRTSLVKEASTNNCKMFGKKGKDMICCCFWYYLSLSSQDTSTDNVPACRILSLISNRTLFYKNLCW